MKLLLDTHIWIWSLSARSRLTDRIAVELEAPENEVWLSPISVWELLLLAEKRRIAIEGDPQRWIADAARAAALREAPLTHEVAVASRTVQLPHQDPADRFLAATAKVYDLTLVTADERLIDCPDVAVLANR